MNKFRFRYYDLFVASDSIVGIVNCAVKLVEATPISGPA